MTVEGGLEEPEALQPEQGSLALLLPGDEHHREDWDKAAAGVLRPAPAVGRPTGVLERRRRQQNGLLAALLLVLVIVVWVGRPDWAARLGIVVLVVLAFPVLRLLLFSRR